jgi:DNA primase catalytic core
MIEKERIEEIKRGVDLVALVESRGIKLKKNGKSFVGLCPFHEDHNPSFSINPDDNLWHCFGCGKGGDVIRFVELYDKVGFKEAVTKLSAESRELREKDKTAENQSSVPDSALPALGSKLPPATRNPPTVKQIKLLSKVVAYYQHTFTQDLRGLNYLKTERGINDNQTLKDFGVGFANGTLSEVLSKDEEVLHNLKQLGVLNPKGNEFFITALFSPCATRTALPWAFTAAASTLKAAFRTFIFRVRVPGLSTGKP